MVRSDVSASLGLALAEVGLGALVLGSLELALLAWGSDPAWALVAEIPLGWLYTATGIFAWWRRPSNRLGALMVLVGYYILFAELFNARPAVLVATGAVLATLVLAGVVHLLLAFPSGRLEGALPRATVISMYLVCLVLQAPLYLFQHVASLLIVANRPGLASIGYWVQAGFGAAVLLSAAVLLLARWLSASRYQRRAALPVCGYGFFAVLFIPLSGGLAHHVFHWSPVALFGAQVLDLAFVPVAFGLGVLLGGFARTGQVEELAAWLSTRAEGATSLLGALSHTVGDPSLQLAYWVPARGHYVDSHGAAVLVPGGGTGRATVEVELRGRRVGALVYDKGVAHEPELVNAAGQVAAMAIDHERLTAELLSSEEALRISRARIVEASDSERRRIAQDLHDGIQAQLVLLGLEAQQVADMAGDSETSRRAEALRRHVDSAASELRQIVHGLAPAALVERGLCAATEDLVDRLPLRTTLRLGVADGTLPRPVENAAYFFVAEALTNALKHSRAQALNVRIDLTAGDLVVEVSDDGVGGAFHGDGHGLRGLADRLDALGGHLSVDSPDGGGTRLTAVLPCA